MAYVRQRGSQLAIVRGVRDAATGKVEQQILMTIYSRAEAREALGPSARRLRSLLRERFPGVSLDWRAISEGLEEKLSVLPETYERAAHAPGRFRETLCAFTRQLGLADPERLSSSAEAIRENTDALLFLRDLIDLRLRQRNARSHKRAADPFEWGLSLEESRIPLDLEELTDGLLERGERGKARAALRLLLDSFGEDADATNSLGHLAFGEGDLEEACARFEEAARIGRRAFPRKIAKRLVGKDLATRPYVRALRNLALAQNRVGQFEAALGTCERLEKECGDALTASSHRAAIGLNTGRFELAWEAARLCVGVFSEEAYAAALAAHELGREEDALAFFLHGALSNRRAARLLLGEPVEESGNRDEARDHEAGAALQCNLGAYLASARGRATVRHFAKLHATPAVAELLSEVETVARRASGDRTQAGWREAFDRLSRMRELAFARDQARRILGSARSGGES